MRPHSYINSAKNILEQYKGEMPLAAWLKAYFSANKKYGSKDRKHISNLCYSYYRLGQSFKDKDIEERLLLGVFLSSQTPVFVLQELKPEWNELITLSPQEKLNHLDATKELSFLFPWQDAVSRAIDKDQLMVSFLIQPSLYLRIRPSKTQLVKQQLSQSAIPYQFKDDACIEVENGVKLETVLAIDKDAVIQDFSSQKVANSLSTYFDTKQSFTAWDCCAASGGKSILLKDLYPKVQLAASDIRQSILHNLRSRFERAEIKQYNSFVADVSKDDFKSSRQYDLVLCDAPCSGSGTWSRTPEQLYFFQEKQIQYYADLQKRIAMNASKAVKKGGYFLYITCSVFTQENEAVVDYLQDKGRLQLMTSTYHIGYDQKADTLFTALFQLG